MGERVAVRAFTHALLAVVVFLTPACGRAGGGVGIALVTEPDGGDTRVEVTGLTADELTALGAAAFDTGAWQQVLRVRVADAPVDQPAVAGTYGVAGGALRFRPLFPFDPGRAYDVTFDRSRVPGAREAGAVSAVVSLPDVEREASTRVTRIMPTADVWPENQLRLYIEFSGPMSRTGGLDYVRLIDVETGQPVVEPFLPLDVEFWNPDRTRYTLFFDPGRVKRGILPNEEMGRALVPGRTYAIEVDAAWRDQHGQPLAQSHRRTFRAGPPDETPVDPGAWRIEPPVAGTRAPLIVTFPDPVDHGLLQRAVGVAIHDGASIPGDVLVGPDELSWRFTPRSPWRAVDHDLVVLSILEDRAGNRVGRRFEVDRFDRVDERPAPDETRIRFEMASAGRQQGPRRR
jgi:hypothetical protein